MFYFKRNTAELKDMLYISSRALGQGATSRSRPPQPARGDCWGSCYRLRSQLQTNLSRALLKRAQTPCALCPVWDRWTPVTWLVCCSGGLVPVRNQRKQKRAVRLERAKKHTAPAPAGQTRGSPGTRRKLQAEAQSTRCWTHPKQDPLQDEAYVSCL